MCFFGLQTKKYQYISMVYKSMSFASISWVWGVKKSLDHFTLIEFTWCSNKQMETITPFCQRSQEDTSGELPRRIAPCSGNCDVVERLTYSSPGHLCQTWRKETKEIPDPLLYCDDLSHNLVVANSKEKNLNNTGIVFNNSLQ